MVRKGDVQWWVLEARKYPESAPLAIEFLAKRLAELDQQNEALRDEVLRLRQRGSSESEGGQVRALRRQIEKLEYLLKSQTATEPTCVLYADGLRSARLPVTEMQRLAHTEQQPLDSRALLSLRALLVARPHDEVLLVTSAGRGTKQSPAHGQDHDDGDDRLDHGGAEEPFRQSFHRTPLHLQSVEESDPAEHHAHEGPQARQSLLVHQVEELTAEQQADDDEAVAGEEHPRLTGKSSGHERSPRTQEGQDDQHDHGDDDLQPAVSIPSEGDSLFPA